MANFQPVDPVALGLCKQIELDSAVAKSSKKLPKVHSSQNSSDLNTIVSTENSLMEPDSKVPSNIVGLEEFSLTDTKNDNKEQIDADSLFSFPDKTKE
jgi:hypothetical protein